MNGFKGQHQFRAIGADANQDNLLQNGEMQDTIFEANWDQAREIVHSHATRLGSETVAIDDCHGRVLAESIVALSDMPPFAAARVDGWAVSGAGPWTSLGDVTAGHEGFPSINPGQCVHIATGAVVPSGTTACLKDEESLLDNGQVSAHLGAVDILVNDALPEGHDIRPVGFEAHAGEVVVAHGTRVTPGIVGIIAAAGHDSVKVFRRITIDVIVFGDELLKSGTSRDGKVRDSLGPQLPAWINYLGAQLLSVTHVQDTLEAHIKAIQNSTADLIITTGGTAAGPVDHLHQAIVDCDGHMLIDAVMIRPGYHQLFAELSGRFLLGLPGNPQSAIIGLLSLGLAFIDGAQDRPLPDLSRFPAGCAIKAPSHEIRMALCTLEGQAVFPVEHLDSSMLRGFSQATGYALIPPGGVVTGDLVRWLNLP